MSLDDLRSRIRPELARSSPYRWQEGIPDGPGRPLRHEHAGRCAGLVRRGDRAPGRAPAQRLPRRLLPAAKRAIAVYAGFDAGPGRGRRRLRRGAAAVRAARARPRRPRAGGASRPTSCTPWPAATRAPRCSRSSRATASRSRARSSCAKAAGRAPGVALLAQQPDRRGARRRARRAHLRGLPGHRRARPGLPGARRRGLLRPHRRAREPRRHAHVLEGLRARRRARRLRPRAARAGRGARRAAPAGLDLVVVGGRGRARLPRDATSCATRCAAIVEERGRLAAGMRSAGVEVLAHAGNFVLARSPVPERLRAARRARLRGAHVRRTSRCWPAASA